VAAADALPRGNAAQGNQNVSQSLMRARVVFQARARACCLQRRLARLTMRARTRQGATVALMLGTSGVLVAKKSS
jgi:hypothetical protein